MLSLLGLEYETVPVDLAAGQHLSEEYLALNPLAEVPVLVDDTTVVRDSQAILVHLGRDTAWYPPAAWSEIQAWLSLAANQVANGPATLRLISLFGAPRDPVAAAAVNARILPIFESRLAGRDWLVGDGPTIADLACYPYLVLAPDGGVDLAPYPALRAWFQRISELPRFVPLG